MDKSPFKLLPLIIVAVCLIILSMIFSATESAFLSINKLRVRFLRNQKNKKAVRVWKLLNNKERLINTLLVSNDIVNISLSSIITIISMDLFGNAAVGAATFISTILLLIFGEISPKTVATHHPEPIAFFFSSFVVFLEVILKPVVYLFTGFSRVILKVFKIDITKRKLSFTEEEIKTFIDVGEEEGVLQKNEKNLMRKVFKFTDLEAKDIMTPRKNIVAISEDSKYNFIIELSERCRLSRFPVYRKDIDDIVGILYLKDLLFYKQNEAEFDVKKVMRNPLFILETKKMSSIQQMLRENHQSMAVVIDEYSGTYGVLTSEDISREIFGQGTDEYESGGHFVELKINNPQNSEIEGLSRITDINEQLGIKLESRRCETIGGFICEKLGHIPLRGEAVIAEGYKFTVIKMEDKRVDRVLVRIKREEND